MLQQVKEYWKSIISDELLAIAKEQHIDESLVKEVGELVVQTPPRPEMGDLAFPLFQYAKLFKTSPPNIVNKLTERLSKKAEIGSGKLLPAGPYLNVIIDVAHLAIQIEKEVSEKKEKYGHSDLLKNKNVMVEFSCPNTNKPLHLGHLRNDAIGMSISRLQEANGANVQKVTSLTTEAYIFVKACLPMKVL